MPVPTITSANTASGTAGQPFSYQVVATNTPTAYVAKYLPAGLNINSQTGLIEGYPQNMGTFAARLHAYNASGTSPEFTLTVTVAQEASDAQVNPVNSGLFTPPTSNVYAGVSVSGGNTVGGTARVSQGNYQSLPVPTGNGTELLARPTSTSGLMLYMPAGSSITHFIADKGSNPLGPANGNQLKVTASTIDIEEPVYLSGNDAVFVTAATNGTGTGNPAILFKWVQR